MDLGTTLLEEEQTPAPLFNWRAHLEVHPACTACPEMPRDELIALGYDIKTNGLRLPIVVHVVGDPGKFQLLDGRSRLDAMAAVGVEFEIERTRGRLSRPSLRLNIPDIPSAQNDHVQMVYEFREDEIKALVLSLNAFRRHLDASGKRAAIDALLKLDPGKSDRQIAEQTGSSPTTVGKRRKKAESAGDVSKMDTRTDAKGRRQPARRSKRGPKHKCSQCGARAPVGEVRQHSYAAYEGVDVWLHDACVAAFEAKEAADRMLAGNASLAALLDGGALAKFGHLLLGALDQKARGAEQAADGVANPSAGNGVGAEPTKEESLAAKIQLEWSEAAAAFENLTSHAVTQIAAAIPHAERKQAATRATEYANLFQALAAHLRGSN